MPHRCIFNASTTGRSRDSAVMTSKTASRTASVLCTTYVALWSTAPKHICILLARCATDHERERLCYGVARSILQRAIRAQGNTEATERELTATLQEFNDRCQDPTYNLPSKSEAPAELDRIVSYRRPLQPDQVDPANDSGSSSITFRRRRRNI